MALSLYRLSQFQILEVNRGRRGLGNYHLRDRLTVCEDINISSQTASVVTSPQDIVDSIRTARDVMTLSAPETSSSSASSASVASSTVKSESQAVQSADDVQLQTSTVETATLTTCERAAHVVRAGLISLNPSLGVFTVVGNTEPRVVKLFPSVSCSCPAQSCYHVKAAQTAVGIREDAGRHQLSLTQLRRNWRKRPDKTAGRKRPKLGDVDIVQAGGINSETLERLQSAVTTNNSSTGATDVEPGVEPSSGSARDDRCVECGAVGRWTHHND